MNSFDLEPSLWLLIAKVFYFLGAIYLTGWAISPGPVFKHSRVFTWVFHQSSGAGLLLLVGFNLVSFDIPAKWVILVPPLLLCIRLVLNKVNPAKQDSYSAECDSFSRSLLIYSLGTVAICVIYLMPFILIGSSGLYAYGGGDHSSYFRVSDLVINQSLKDLMLSWGLAWPPTTDYVGMSATSSMFPPVPDWSINSFLFYIKYARQSMTFANQTIGVPFIALGINNPEESYTAGVTVYLLLLCWSAAIFVSTLTIHSAGTKVLALSASAVAIASPAMSLVLKQTIPAVYAWGSMLMFLSVLVLRHTENHKTMGMPIPFGIAIASTYLMYLPAIFVSGPLWAYLFLKNITHFWKERLKWVLGILAVLAISANLEIDRPVILFLSNATGAILNYGLTLNSLPITLLGVADFESAMNQQISLSKTYLAGITVLVGLYFYVKQLNKRINIALIFVMPILFSIAYYWQKGGHYHVIRMVEFLGVVFVAMSVAGFASVYSSTTRKRILVLSALAGIFILNAVHIKIGINKKVINPVPEARAGIIDAKDVKFVRSLEHEFAALGHPPVVYWMGWGTVPFANHEITFRKLKYVEAFEYDYAYVKLDLLDPQQLKDAVLVYPTNNLVDILRVEPDALKNDKSELEGITIQRVGQKSGAAVLGTGWMPVTIEGGKPVRYLRSAQEGGLVVWSEEQKSVQVEIEAVGVEPGMFLTLRRPEQENKFLAKDELFFRSGSESSAQFFTRIKNLISQDKGTQEVLYGVNMEMQMGGHMQLDQAAFNAHLYRSELFKRFIIKDIEAGGMLTKNLVKDYQAQQLTYKLNAFHDSAPTTIKFNLDLHQGANILRFIARDSLGRRSGRDPVTGVFFNPEINVPAIVIYKIKVKK